VREQKKVGNRCTRSNLKNEKRMKEKMRERELERKKKNARES